MSNGVATVERVPLWRHALRRRDVAIALVLAAVSLLCRWPFIVCGETLLHTDECIVGLMAQDIAEGVRYPVYFYGQGYMGALEAYVMALVRQAVDDPIVVLRLTPALFLSLLVGLQYLMLARWFGRLGGLLGAATLIAAAPMFVQWSISARGGYIEIMFWGSLLWWSYSEWFIRPAPVTRRMLRQFVFGFLIGSGLWLNETIVVFLAPIFVHALMDKPLAFLWGRPRCGKFLRGVDRLFLRLPLVLPVSCVLGVFVLSALMSLQPAGQGEVRRVMLFGLVHQGVAAMVFTGAAVVLIAWIALRTRLAAQLIELLGRNASIMFGIVVGLLPKIFYALNHLLSGEPREPTLAFGLRAPWAVGETVTFLLRGLPVLLGADPQPFLTLRSTGVQYNLAPLNPALASGMHFLNWVIGTGLLVATFVILTTYGRELASLLRAKPGSHGPVAFLVVGVAGLACSYVISGWIFEFMTIRYLVVVWAFVPGLLAAVVVSRRMCMIARCSVAAVLMTWILGQVGMCLQLGGSHPLRKLADELDNRDIRFAFADQLDAQVLTFLTQKRCCVLEYAPFASRLDHYRVRASASAETPPYIATADQIDWIVRWRGASWPGPAPQETAPRPLYSQLRLLSEACPSRVVSRRPLADGYTLWQLRSPLPPPGSP